MGEKIIEHVSLTSLAVYYLYKYMYVYINVYIAIHICRRYNISLRTENAK